MSRNFKTLLIYIICLILMCGQTLGYADGGASAPPNILSVLEDSDCITVLGYTYPNTRVSLSVSKEMDDNSDYKNNFADFTTYVDQTESDAMGKYLFNVILTESGRYQIQTNANGTLATVSYLYDSSIKTASVKGGVNVSGTAKYPNKPVTIEVYKDSFDKNKYSSFENLVYIDSTYTKGNKSFEFNFALPDSGNYIIRTYFDNCTHYNTFVYNRIVDVDAEIKSGMLGNNYFGNKTVPIILDIKDGIPDSITVDVRYSLINRETGAEVKNDVVSGVELSNGENIIKLTDIPFGLFTVELSFVSSGTSAYIYKSNPLDIAVINGNTGAKNKRVGIQDGSLLGNGYTVDDIANAVDFMDKAGCGINRTSLYWSNYENADGSYVLKDTFKRMVEECNSRDIDFIGILGGIGSLTGKYGDFADDKQDTTINVTTLNAFKNATSQMLNDINNIGHIEYIEPSNEPMYVVSTDVYADMLKGIYPIIKQSMPNTIVLGPTGGSVNDSNYFLKVMDPSNYDAYKYIDGVSIHNYVSLPENTVSQSTYDHYGIETISKMKEMVERGNVARLLCGIPKYSEFINTETGWTTCEPSETYTATYATEKEQADYSVRSVIFNEAVHGLSKNVLYSICDPPQTSSSVSNEAQMHYGLLHAKDAEIPYSAKPAYLAVANMNTLLADASVDSYTVSDGVYNVAYAKANGQRINVIWAPNAEKNYTVSEMGSIVTVIDIYGNTRYQNTENGSLTVTATDSPLYVINSGFDYCVISNGSRVQNLDDISGNVFDVSINATLSSNEVKNYLVICAQYDGNRLLSIKFIPISEADYIQDSLSKSVSVDKCTNTNKIKLFRMKNLSSLIPLSDSLEIN